MKRLVLFAMLMWSALAATAATFDEFTGSFTDESRKREIPYRIYYPNPLVKKYPVVIVSHGLGGSRDGNAILGKQLASHGFIAIHIQHAGSDAAMYAGARDPRAAQSAMEKAQSPANAVARFLDVPYVVDQVPRLNVTDDRLTGHVDIRSIGIAGHSYGSISAMVAAGERMGEHYQSIKVPAIKAALSLSPSPPGAGLDPVRAYADVAIPIFHMTGTDDVNLVERGRSIRAKDRVIPYRTLAIPNQYLLVLNKADHITFSGGRIGTRAERAADKKHMMAVVNGALAFFQAYLTDNKDAEAWLRTEFKKTLDPEDEFEFK